MNKFEGYSISVKYFRKIWFLVRDHTEWRRIPEYLKETCIEDSLWRIHLFRIAGIRDMYLLLFWTVVSLKSGLSVNCQNSSSCRIRCGWLALLKAEVCRVGLVGLAGMGIVACQRGSRFGSDLSSTRFVPAPESASPRLYLRVT